MSDREQDAPTGPANPRGNAGPDAPTPPGGPQRSDAPQGYAGQGADPATEPEPEVHAGTADDGSSSPEPTADGRIHATSQADRVNEEMQEENAETALDQPSDGSGGE